MGRMSDKKLFDQPWSERRCAREWFEKHFNPMYKLPEECKKDLVCFGYCFYIQNQDGSKVRINPSDVVMVKMESVENEPQNQ